MENLSSQARNSISLYRGNNPSTIAQLLSFQRRGIVEELKRYFDARTTDELAIKLSMNR